MKNFKKLLILTLAFVLMLSCVAFAADEIGVQINGKDVLFTDVKPVNKDGVVFIPLRAVFEAAGADVFWEGETQTIISSLGEDKVIMQIANPVIFINSDTTYTMDLAPYIENNRTYIPVYAFTMGFGYNHSENGNTISFVK